MKPGLPGRLSDEVVGFTVGVRASGSGVGTSSTKCVDEMWELRDSEGDGPWKMEPGEASGEDCFIFWKLIGRKKTKTSS